MDKESTVGPKKRVSVTWLLRILFSVLLLLMLLPAAVWLSFPWYAQSLADRAFAGKPFRIEVSGVGLPGFSGVRFRSMKVFVTTPPDGCSDAADYTLLLTDGLISWNFQHSDTPDAGTFLPKIFSATCTIKADSLSLKPKTEEFVFSDRNPEITAKIEISHNQAFKFSFKPILATYPIDSAAVTREKLRLEGVKFKVRLSAENTWQQPLDTLHVSQLFSDGNQSPVGNFKALFGSKRNPLKPCTLTLTNCSVELFEWKASTDRIEYSLKEKRSRFTLRLAEIPVAELPGFKGSTSRTPFVTGRVSGFIPVEFQDSTVNVRNAVIIAGKNTRIIFYNNQKRPWLSFDFGIGEIAKNLNANVILNSRNKKLSGLSISNLSATVLGGTVTSTPVSFNPSANTTRLTLRLNKVKALDRVRLHGDFKGSLKGTISGTIPLVITKKGLSISNAHVQSPGGGTVRFAPPSIQQSTKERIFGTKKPDADYTFSEPDLVFNRSLYGTTTISFSMKKLLRKTDGGEMQLLSPKGIFMLGHNRPNMDTVTLSNFSAGFLDGKVAIDHIDYDMAKKEGKTTLQVNNIPLQKLLDLQGTKKIYATGNVKGDIPITMSGDQFEITNGGMNAEQSGQIIYASTPEERAAANQGLRTTYEALSNFLYVHLVSSINMARDGKSVISLQLKGTNPDFQGGRAIELNLNVEQNLLDLMRSLSISANVEQVISEKALQIQKK